MSDRTATGQFTSASASESLGWGVGRLSWLDSAASKVMRYWRQVEYGNEDMIGRYLGGLWSTEPGARGSRISGDLSPFGTSNQEQFVPFHRTMETYEDAVAGARAALFYLYEQGRLGETDRANRALYFTFLHRIRDDDMRVPTFGQVHKAVVGKEAYAKAMEDFDPIQQQTAVIDEIFSGMGFATGKRVRQKAPITGRELSVRVGGLLKVSVTSGYNRSLLRVDKQFQSELIKANRMLAIGFQDRVASFYEQLERAGVSTGQLIAAHEAPENRFPQ